MQIAQSQSAKAKGANEAMQRKCWKRQAGRKELASAWRKTCGARVRNNKRISVDDRPSGGDSAQGTAHALAHGYSRKELHGY
jgi:hypothetical protein